MEKPSTLIRRHVEGTGNGFELDDLLSRRTGPLFDSIGDAILKIHQEYKNDEFPIGISNPQSFDKLWQLAEVLDRQGN